MRLINTRSYEIREFYDNNIPDYGILSHRWEHDEVTLQNFINGSTRDTQGDIKIRRFCRLIRFKYDWAWVDTCCIDKTSSAELSEAINSMYRWYRNAKTCVVYLSDIDANMPFSRSVWFLRGWTLQELLAPSQLEFYNKNWKLIGTREDLADLVQNITGIGIEMLSIRPKMIGGPVPDGVRFILDRQRQKCIHTASVAHKLSWAAQRFTSRIEDQAYCLLGLFQINMPLLYGEGTKAVGRLLREVLRESDDESIFAWWPSFSKRVDAGALATSIYHFKEQSSVRELSAEDMGGRTLAARKPYYTTNKGLCIETVLLKLFVDEHGTCNYGIPLRCTDGPPGVCSYPLVLRVFQDPEDLSGKRYLRRGPPQQLGDDQWMSVLQSDRTDNFETRLSSLPRQELFIPLTYLVTRDWGLRDSMALSMAREMSQGNPINSHTLEKDVR